MRTWMVSAVITGMLLAGCTTTHLAGRLELPANARIVGGGLSIEWAAPAKGAAILVETTSGKIVRTQSLDTGDTFSFDPLANENTRLLNSMFGGLGPQDNQELSPLPAVTRFVLYFVPETNAQP
jgi:hypothetical protein